MNTQNPQEAFFSWLVESLGRALAALGSPDYAQRRAGSPVSQLTH